MGRRVNLSLQLRRTGGFMWAIRSPTTVSLRGPTLLQISILVQVTVVHSRTRTIRIVP